jgi:UDP-N-acetylglucosamine transferase subunit ALG13
MIFVSVGTNEARFDRLLAGLAALGVEEELLVQHGHSVPPELDRAVLVDFLTFEEMAASIRRARAFVTHAGVGSVMVGLANGKRPVVVPRRKAFGEAVDDHQLQLARRFADAGLVTLVESPEDLAPALAATSHDGTAPRAGELAADLSAYLAATIPHPSAVQPTCATRLRRSRRGSCPASSGR